LRVIISSRSAADITGAAGIALDACSRRIVGWSMATTLTNPAAARALNMALSYPECRRRRAHPYWKI
jgi:transposase InsO family protein